MKALAYPAASPEDQKTMKDFAEALTIVLERKHTQVVSMYPTFMVKDIPGWTKYIIRHRKINGRRVVYLDRKFVVTLHRPKQ